MEGLGTLVGAIQNGSIKPLAITSLQRLPNFPDIPTVTGSLPDFVATGWFALLAPRATPEHIVKQVNRDLNEALLAPAVEDKLDAMATIVRPASIADTAAFLSREQEAWHPVVMQMGLAPQ